MSLGVFVVLYLSIYTINAVPVEGIAAVFEDMQIAISNAKITWLETNKIIYTANDGTFSFDAPVGAQVTLLLEKYLFHTTQSATLIVPPGGLTGKYNQIVFQIPDVAIWDFFLLALPDTGKNALDPTKCHVVVTVCAANKTYLDGLQGEVNSTVSVDPAVPQEPFYFGVYDGLTNPFARGLTEVSADGGVLWFNIEPSDKLYEISAHKKGKRFTTTKIWCQPGRFINTAPNQGPRVIE